MPSGDHDTVIHLFRQKLEELANEPDSVPIDVTLQTMIDQVGFAYKGMDILANREYKISSTDDPNKAVRTKRFRLFVAKGPGQLRSMFSTSQRYQEAVSSDGHGKMGQFYSYIFNSEPVENIEASLNDPECWHLVLVGYRNRYESDEKVQSFEPWIILAACSFINFPEHFSLNIKWLAVDGSEKATHGRWNPGGNNRKHDKDVESYFDDESFRFSKGLGTTMLALSQYVCKNLNRSERTVAIYVQSSLQSLAFYKLAIGMTEVTNISTVPQEIEATFLISKNLVLLKLDDEVTISRPPTISTISYNFLEFWRKALGTYIATMRAQKRPKEIFTMNFAAPGKSQSNKVHYRCIKNELAPLKLNPTFEIKKPLSSD